MQTLIDQRVTRLTYGGYDRDGKVEGSCEFPLHPGPVGFGLHDDALQLAVIILADVIFPLEALLLGFQLLLLAHLEVRLQGVEDGGADQQVRKRANDQGQGPHVLPLHRQQESAAEGLMSLRGPREVAATVGEAVWTAPGGGGAEGCALWTADSGGPADVPRLVVIPVTDPRILLLVGGETQETAGSSGPGALQPRDPAQDLHEPSPPCAQCHQQAAFEVSCWSVSPQTNSELMLPT